MEPIIRTTRIAGTQTIVYTAWEAYNGHHTITHIDGVKVGRIGTNPLPKEIDALKAMTDERSRAVRGWINSQYERAYNAIIAKHPEVAKARRDMGEIEVY